MKPLELANREWERDLLVRESNIDCRAIYLEITKRGKTVGAVLKGSEPREVRDWLSAWLKARKGKS